MSGWQYAAQNTSLAIYCVQRFLVMFGETFNLLKTPFEYRDQNFCDITFRNTIHIAQRRILNEYKLRRERLTKMIAMKYFVNNFLPR